MTLKKCDRCGATMDDKATDGWQQLFHAPLYCDPAMPGIPMGEFCEQCWMEISHFAETKGREWWIQLTAGGKKLSIFAWEKPETPKHWIKVREVFE